MKRTWPLFVFLAALIVAVGSGAKLGLADVGPAYPPGGKGNQVILRQNGPFVDVHRMFETRTGPVTVTIDGISSFCYFYHWPTIQGTKTVAICNGNDYPH